MAMGLGWGPSAVYVEVDAHPVGALPLLSGPSPMTWTSVKRPCARVTQSLSSSLSRMSEGVREA